MKKKIGYLLTFGLFVSTTKPINLWPFSPAATKNLSPEQKAIRTIIKNCSDISLDPKFNLERFLEKQQPRTVYAWVTLLKINSRLNAAEKELPYAKSTIDIQRGLDLESIIASAKKEKVLFKEQVQSVDPNNYSFLDHNSINPSCADIILAQLEKDFPYLKEKTLSSKPLPTDQVSILMQQFINPPKADQVRAPLPVKNQTLIRELLQKTPANMIFLYFKLWGINDDKDQGSKIALLEKIETTAWNNYPEGHALEALKKSADSTRGAVSACHYENMVYHDYIGDCDAIQRGLTAIENDLKHALAQGAVLEKPFKEKFVKEFPLTPAYSLSVPSDLSRSVTRYLQSYFPELS